MKFVHGGNIYDNPLLRPLDFSANINPLGLPASVKTAIADNIELYSAYPDPLCRELRAALADFYHILPSQIVCGNGAADLIFRLVLSKKPKKALIVSPTFSEYEEALSLVECEISHHFLLSENDFALDDTLFSALNSELDMVFICNPNNPTGLARETNFMKKIAYECEKNGIILVVDECFNDFLEEAENYSLVASLTQFENVFILKAFTKFYAMAGIRLGYGLSSDVALIEALHKTLQPWSVSTVACKSGVAALSETEYARKTRELITKNRACLKDGLSRLGLKVFDSRANYIFFKCDILNLSEKFKLFNILIRSCENYPGLDCSYYRIAVRSEKENENLLRCFKQILEGLYGGTYNNN